MKDREVGNGAQTAQRVVPQLVARPPVRQREPGELPRRRGHHRPRVEDARRLGEKRDQGENDWEEQGGLDAHLAGPVRGSSHLSTPGRP